MLYTDCQNGRTAAIAGHVSFVQITCYNHQNIFYRLTAYFVRTAKLTFAHGCRCDLCRHDF